MEHGFKRQDAPLQRLNERTRFVLRRGSDDEVVGAIIVAYAVHVMHVFIGSKPTTKRLFHYMPVLKPSLSRANSNGHVALALIDTSPALPSVMAGPTGPRVVSAVFNAHPVLVEPIQYGAMAESASSRDLVTTETSRIPPKDVCGRNVRAYIRDAVAVATQLVADRVWDNAKSCRQRLRAVSGLDCGPQFVGGQSNRLSSFARALGTAHLTIIPSNEVSFG